MNKVGPIYFGVTVWGRPFCESFLNYALASLLAGGNIPALANPAGENLFLIYTTTEDKLWLQEQKLMKRLKAYMRVEFIEMSPLSEAAYQTLNNGLRSNKLYTMTCGHRKILERMYADKATGSIVLADSIYANHSISAAYQHIVAGKMAVLAFCPRFSTTAILDDLAQQHYVQEGMPLSIEPRELIKAAMRHLHTDVQMQRWLAPFCPEFMFEPNWILPDDLGLLFHSWTCWYAFINYDCLAVHNTSSLEHNTIDGTYFGENLIKEECHLMTDSDEFTLISFSPEIERRVVPIKLSEKLPRQMIQDKLKTAFVKKKIKTTSSQQTELFKLHFAHHAIFMHTADLTPACYEQQAQAQRIIDKIMNGPFTRIDQGLAWHMEHRCGFYELVRHIAKQGLLRILRKDSRLFKRLQEKGIHAR